MDWWIDAAAKAIWVVQRIFETDQFADQSIVAAIGITAFDPKQIIQLQFGLGRIPRRAWRHQAGAA